jgi:peptidoglycan/LPS O-acetylase OafA/YrhL
MSDEYPMPGKAGTQRRRLLYKAFQTGTIPPGRIPAIDTLRGIAALVVIFWHYQFFFGPKPLSPLFDPFYTNGQAAVDVFFVISGFILSYVYLDRISDRSDARRYAVRRIARLYPLHLVTLIAVAVIFGGFWFATGQYAYVYTQNDFYHFVLNLTLLQYVGPQLGYSFNGPSWSISTEFWINIVFVLGVLLVRQRLQLPLSLLVVAISAWAIIKYGHGQLWRGGPKWGGWFEHNLARTACGFYAGVIVFLLWRRVPRLPAIGELAFFLGAGMFLYLISIRQGGPNEMLIGSLIALAAAPLMVFGCAASASINVACSMLLGRWIGDISYSIYMWHFPVAAILVLAGAKNAYASHDWLAAVYVVIVLMVATASYHWLEVPAREWIVERFAKRSMRELASNA